MLVGVIFYAVLVTAMVAGMLSNSSPIIRILGWLALLLATTMAWSAIDAWRNPKHWDQSNQDEETEDERDESGT